jgi:hypothetical protein
VVDCGASRGYQQSNHRAEIEHFHPDSLLRTDIKGFSTAHGNAGVNFGGKAPVAQPDFMYPIEFECRKIKIESA